MTLSSTNNNDTLAWDGPIKPVDPTTLLDLVPLDATPQLELDEVVERSHAAFKNWRVDAVARSRTLLAWADALRLETDSLAADLVTETGKPIREALSEVIAAADCLEYNAGLARLSDGNAGTLSDGTSSHVVREPVGVSLFLVPWNWPMLLLFRDLSPALASGVTTVIKPAPQTTHITNRVVEIGYRAGIPNDVVAVVRGDVAVAQHLLHHKYIRAVAFTGSTRVGEIVLAASARNMVRPLLELGGKNPAVVFADADLDKALPLLARSALITSGQMCMASSRLLVHKSIYKDTVSIVQEIFQGMVLGDPADPTIDLGPLISPAHACSVSNAVEEARIAHEVIGGNLVHPNGLEGHFVEPTIVAGPDPDSAIVNSDLFGPVLTIETFDDDDAAIDLANHTKYGLVAGVWTTNTDRAMRVASEINAGTVWVNGWGRTYPEVPAGGFKSSGLGRTRGTAGLHQFTELKHIHIS